MPLEDPLKIAITVTKETQGIVVRLKGEIGAIEADALKGELLRILGMRPKRVVFDLADLYFISSPGMGAFAAFRRSVVTSKGRVFLTQVPDKLQPVVKIAGLNQLYETCATVAEALNKP